MPCEPGCFEGHELRCDLSAESSKKHKLQTEPGGALLGFQFASLLCRRTRTYMQSDCTGNLRQNPHDPSPSDFSA